MAPQSMKKVRRKDAWHTPIEKDIGESPQNMLGNSFNIGATVGVHEKIYGI